MAIDWDHVQTRFTGAMLILITVAVFGGWATTSRIEAKVGDIERRMGRVEGALERHIESHGKANR